MKEAESEKEQKAIAEVLLGKKESFSLIVESYQPTLQGFCSRLLSCRETGRDAAQETFVRAFYKLNTYDQERSFKAWLFKIARNHCYDLLRKRKRGLEFQTSDGELPQKSEGHDFSSAIEAKDLAGKVLAQLPEKNREVILLREAYEMSYQEISVVVGTSVNSVKSRLKRARKEVLAIAGSLSV